MGILSVKNVSHSYVKDKPVLKDISLDFEQGKMYVIFGPSGCGKTTLLSVMGGLDVPSGGQVLFDGKNIQQLGLEKHRRQNVAFVFQNYNLIDYMTPAENVNLTSKKDPMPFLEQVGLTREEAKRNVLKLSGGQQQRVAIARALASGAPVILADEPTGNLDEDTAQGITALLKRNAHQDGKCVIVVSHSGEVASQADVVLRLTHGMLEAMDAPDAPEA
nr:ABC transporter ATP-binding protein [Maliibacterium massiliense]